MRALRLACAIATQICVLSIRMHACIVLPNTVAIGPDFVVTVADRGRPVGGLRLQVGGKQAITNDAGIAMFREVAPGMYLLTPDHDDGVSDAVYLQVSKNGPHNVNVHLKWPAVPPIEVRSLAGKLNCAGCGDPSATPYNVSVLDGLSGQILHHARTTNSGEFSFAAMPNGFYFLQMQQITSVARKADGLIGVVVSSKAKQKELHLDLGMTSCGLMYTNMDECSTPEIEANSFSG